MDLQRLAALLERAQPGEVPVGLLTVTNNTIGGLPVSMANVDVAARRRTLRGYRILRQAPFLRAFTAELEPAAVPAPSAV